MGSKCYFIASPLFHFERLELKKKTSIEFHIDASNHVEACGHGAVVKELLRSRQDCNDAATFATATNLKRAEINLRAEHTRINLHASSICEFLGP